MTNEQEYISVNAFCSSHELDVAFLYSLQEFELVHLEEKDELVIPVSDLPKLEQYVELHYGLEINLEGLQAIDHLLEKMQGLQHEVAVLRNKIAFYEQSFQSHTS